MFFSKTHLKRLLKIKNVNKNTDVNHRQSFGLRCRGNWTFSTQSWNLIIKYMKIHNSPSSKDDSVIFKRTCFIGSWINLERNSKTAKEKQYFFQVRSSGSVEEEKFMMISCHLRFYCHGVADCEVGVEWISISRLIIQSDLAFFTASHLTMSHDLLQILPPSWPN